MNSKNKTEVWTIDDLVKGTGGRLLQKGNRPLCGVGTDSRQDLTGHIFFALKGDNFDAHEFVGQAVEKGAAAVVVQKEIPKVSADATVIQVEDVLLALQSFATFHRRRFHGKVVGLTGSNGKTTTKEICATILQEKYSTYATQGNLNNHIGVPLTLLALREGHKVAVVEMGMNHAGEIKDLVTIAEPDIVMVTNVGRAHIEAFGTIENIAKAKEEIYEYAPLKATRIYNLDSTHTATMRARAPGDCKVLTYSSYAKDVDVSLKEKVFTFDYIDLQGVIAGEPGTARMHVFGRQQVSNAMAAACVAIACGVEPPLIWKALNKCKGTWGRGQMIDLDCGAKVLFDGYNANPDSSILAFENFSRLSARGKKYVVMGEMLELGDLSEKFHEEIGAALAQVNPEAVLLVGSKNDELERGLKSNGFDKKIIKTDAYKQTLAESFGHMLQTGDIVLVKGSRGMKLEKFVGAWKPHGFTEKH